MDGSLHVTHEAPPVWIWLLLETKFGKLNAETMIMRAASIRYEKSSNEV